MEDMRRIAYEIVLRACGFGSLAIFCIMIGLSFEPRAAFQTGGFLTLLMAGILILKAYWAPRKDYRHTEMWLYLPEDRRPPKAYAQFTISTILQETVCLVRPVDSDYFDCDVVHSPVFFSDRALRVTGTEESNLKTRNSQPPTSARSRWQNGYAERLIGSIRRECLDHIVVTGEQHLRHVLKCYMEYYNAVRTHLSLGKDAPIWRDIQCAGRIEVQPVLGGLHHQYVRI